MTCEEFRDWTLSLSGTDSRGEIAACIAHQFDCDECRDFRNKLLAMIQAIVPHKVAESQAAAAAKRALVYADPEAAEVIKVAIGRYVRRKGSAS